MADAYARTTGRPAVVTVHQGCGLTNAMTGIAEAAKSRTPLLVLAADTGRRPCGPTSASTRTRWCARSARCRSGCTRPPRRPPTWSGPTGRPSSSGARWCSICRWTCRPRPPRTCRSPAMPRLGPVRPAAVAAFAGTARDGGAARVHRGSRRRRPGASCGRSAPLRSAARDLGRRARPVRRRPVVARDLRRVRLTAGRGADPRRGPGRRLGLRAEHVDDRHGR